MYSITPNSSSIKAMGFFLRLVCRERGFKNGLKGLSLNKKIPIPYTDYFSEVFTFSGNTKSFEFSGPYDRDSETRTK